MGSATFHRHSGHTKPDSAIHRRAVSPNPTCSSGGFYKAPSNGATVDSLKPLEIEWDTTCLETEKVDIHLTAPWIDRANTEMAVWYEVLFSKGKATVNIKPKWWNATTSAKLQITIVPAGTPPSLATLPAGPFITATYTPPADGSTPPAADTSKPDTPDTVSATTNKHLSPGKTAAAVLIPLLAVLGLGLFAFFRWQRRKATKHTLAFSQAVDKRMSTISSDWKSMSPAGAQAAIRASVAVRDSSAFAFGAIRPMSTVDNVADDGDHQMTMTQVRTGTGVGLRHPNASAAALAAQRASRISKVSFADSARPSGENIRRTKALNSTYIPPVPTTHRGNVISAASVYPDSELEKDEKEVHAHMHSPTLSPRQATGPLTLTSDDIRVRIQGGQREEEKDKEYDEVMPALSMMRTGLGSPTTPTATHHHHQDDDYILPVPPAPVHAASSSPPSYTSSVYAPNTAASTATSPFTVSAYATTNTTPSSPISPLPPIAARGAPTPPPQGMSPDDMLRAYAVRQASSGGAATGVPGSPKTSKGGRKLSLRASLGLKKSSSSHYQHQNQNQQQQQQQQQQGYHDKARIGYPMVNSPSDSSPVVGEESAGMAGVGRRKMSAGAGMGMAGVGAGAGMALGAGAHYAIGEDEEDMMDYEDAYVGTAN